LFGFDKVSLVNFSQLIPLTAALVNLALTIFVLSRGVNSAIQRVYFLWGASIVIWNLGTFFMFSVQSEASALFWARFLQFGVIFLPISLAHLCLLIAEVNWGRKIIYLYSVHVALAICNFTPLFISGVKNVGYAYYASAGIGFWLFVTTYLVPIIAVMTFHSRLKQFPQLQRRRLYAMIFAVVLLIVFGINDTLPILGIYKYPFTNLSIFPLGSLMAIFYGIIVGYSVLQHQLLNIHVGLGRVAAHVIRLGFVFIIGLVSLLVISSIFSSYFTMVSFLGSLVVLGISMSAASFLFPRLFGSGSERFERQMLGDRFEYHDQIRAFISNMHWYSNLDQLSKDLDNLLVKIVRVASYKIILLDENRIGFSLFQSHPEESQKGSLDIKIDSPVFEYFKAYKSDFLSINGLGRKTQELNVRAQLERFHSEYCFPYFFESEPFGLLLVGGKSTDEPYTHTDLNLLTDLSKQLGVLINQIRMKNQLLQAEEMELLGKMSRGMAHDLNNLLTPLWTFLQLSSEGVSAKDLHDDLLPLALRNLKTMRAYIREALFFSENLRPDFQYGRLDVVLAQAAEMVKPRAEGRRVNVAVETPMKVLAEIDEVLMQRLVANLISNSIDASPPQTTVRVELVRLVKTEAQRDWLRIRVIDSGEGIKQENLSRVLAPYFTTKNRGDETRGFGLGLAICRKIVHLHGGHLNISSQWNKGTTVQVDLPNRQTKSHNGEPANIS
jgi:signal transduction histidine kinase